MYGLPSNRVWPSCIPVAISMARSNVAMRLSFLLVKGLKKRPLTSNLNVAYGVTAMDGFVKSR